MKFNHIKLGEVCDFVRGVTFNSDEAQASKLTGHVPILRAGNIGDTLDTFNDLVWVPAERVSAEQRMRIGDIAICMSSGSPEVLGKTAQLEEPFEGSVGAFCGIIRPREAECAKYVACWLRSQGFMAWRNQQARGINIQNLRFSELESISIPYPSLPEQKRIAAILDKADRLRRLRRYALELGDTYLQSVFLEMFGDPVTNPKRWAVKPLGDLIDGFDAGVNFPPVSGSEQSSPWRVLKVSAVTWGDFDPDESKPISPDIEIDDSIVVRKGDLLMSRANTTELVGAVCLVRQDPPKVILPDKLWRIRFPKDALLLPEYTLAALRQPALRKIIGGLATGSSGSMKNISMEKATTLPIHIAPLSFQEKFGHIAQEFDRLRAQQREAERQAEHLFQSLLRRAFRP